jgi:serine/threonine protein kinase
MLLLKLQVNLLCFVLSVVCCLHMLIFLLMIDFGLSSYMSSSVIGRAVDNPTWCAPETLKGGGIYMRVVLCVSFLNRFAIEHGRASDVYAYGVILYELLMRRTYFGDMKFMHMVEDEVLAGRRPPLPRSMSGPFMATYVRLVERYVLFTHHHHHHHHHHYLNTTHIRCWAQEASARPTFVDVQPELQSLSPFNSRAAIAAVGASLTTSSLGSLGDSSRDERRPGGLLIP